MKTDFVPKLVGTITALCAVHLVLVLSDRLLTVKALASIGYFEAQVSHKNYFYYNMNIRIAHCIISY